MDPNCFWLILNVLRKIKIPEISISFSHFLSCSPTWAGINLYKETDGKVLANNLKKKNKKKKTLHLSQFFYSLHF